VRVLHTSDWHVGRTVRGRSREDEHRAVFAEMAALARDEGVDLVLVAGDVFDHQSPSASAEDVVYEALLRFAEAGAQVVMIAGNHDHPDRLEAVRPLLKLANIHAGARLRRPEDGGCVDVAVRSSETARVALLPWPSKSRIVTAADLMLKDQGQQQGQYADRCGEILQVLSSSFARDTVNLVVAHLAMTGSQAGGGERPSEVIEDYWVPRDKLNVNAQYVALGHYHRAQDLGTLYPAWYCGSPLQLDFGEEDDTKGVLVLEATAGSPVRAPRLIPLTSGRRMLTVFGSVAELARRNDAGEFGDAYLRVYVSEPMRSGLAEEVRQLLPNAVEVKIDLPVIAGGEVLSGRDTMTPHDLLAAYFEHANVRDDKVLKLFDDLLEEEIATPSA
jgi:exonuclease SbcD